MLIIMKKTATEENLQAVKQYLIDLDFDFHQSTGANRIIIGVIGEVRLLDPARIQELPGVHAVFKIPEEL